MVILKAEAVAKRLKISKQTLVRYEKKGIFPKPKRNRINHWREYYEEDVRRMEHIMGRSGLTLIELIMVLVIVGILAGLAIPRFDSFYFLKFSGAVKKIISDIQYVQQLAIAKHTRARLVFDVFQESYQAQEESPADSGTWVYIVDPFTRRNIQVDFDTDPQYSGIKIESVNFGSTDTLSFDWMGVPANGNNQVLTSDGIAVFSYRSGAYANTIAVTANTGRTRIQ